MGGHKGGRGGSDRATCRDNQPVPTTDRPTSLASLADCADRDGRQERDEMGARAAQLYSCTAEARGAEGEEGPEGCVRSRWRPGRRSRSLASERPAASGRRARRGWPCVARSPFLGIHVRRAITATRHKSASHMPRHGGTVVSSSTGYCFPETVGSRVARARTDCGPMIAEFGRQNRARAVGSGVKTGLRLPQGT